jgi:hypothetical protein
MMPQARTTWLAFVGQCQQWLTQQQQQLEATYQLAGCQWEIQQDTGTITYWRERRAVAVARVVMLGSYHIPKSTWMWAWANPSVNTTYALPEQQMMAISKVLAMRQLVAPVIAVAQTPVLWRDQQHDQANAGRVAVARLVSVAAYQIRGDGVHFFRTRHGIGAAALQHVYRPVDAG